MYSLLKLNKYGTINCQTTLTFFYYMIKFGAYIFATMNFLILLEHNSLFSIIFISFNFKQ